MLPYYFLQANETLGIKFDAIVVDEGQSLKKDWWGVLEPLLVDPKESYFFIFYDDLQRIYEEVINPVPGEDQPFELYINLRNTANIHRQVTKYLPKEKLPESNNIIGESVWIDYYHDDRSMRDSLRKILHHLIREGGVSTKDIIILTPKKKTSILPNIDHIGPYKIVSIETNDPSAIRYTTCQSFRGMERQVVILTELDSDVPDICSLVYLGGSRAKTKLVMQLSTRLNPQLTETLISGCEKFEYKIS